MPNSLFITGASGFIGSRLLEALEPDEFEAIRLLSRGSVTVPDSLRAAGNVEVVRGDLEDPRAYAPCLDANTTVVHAAAVTGAARPKEYEAVNVRGLVSWIGFRQGAVSYSRDARYAGETKYPYRKMIRFALDGITSFSSVPLKFASWLGYLASSLAFLYLASVFVQKALGYTVPGFATIMVAMLFLGGVQLICLGIIGEYIGRIFDETKARPLYIVEGLHGALTTAGTSPDDTTADPPGARRETPI